MKQDRKSNLKLQYKKVLELGLIASLIVHIFLFQGFKRVKQRDVKQTVRLEAIAVEDIPQTQREKSAPAPSRPTVPIASEDETLPDDETIDFTDLDLDAEPPPPPPPPEVDDDVPMFIPHDEPPEPIGGYAAIQRNLIYPEIAQKAGIEGRVLIQAKIGIDGTVKRTVVQISLGPNGCDEAATTAIRAVKWKPAMQRDRPVEVWVAVPVEFKLK